MLTFFQDTIFDNRTELERKLDDLAEKYRLKRELSKLDQNKIRFNINKKDILVRLSIATISVLILACKCSVVYGADFSKIDTAGKLLHTAVMKVYRWTASIIIAIDVITAMTSKAEKTDYIKIIMKYAIGTIAILSFPWIYEIISEMFS